jgi:phytoene dehydrogenase-like protein
MYDTIIIGAGLSGIAAGIRLAYYDKRVCILEKHYTIGGLNSFYRLRKRDYDVGLHAITNFTPQGEKKGPLARLLRQLRMKWEDLELAPQVGSAIAFPGVELAFGNGFQILESEVAAKFPKQIDGFRRMAAAITQYDDLTQENFSASGRDFVAQFLTDPLLIEMILCPLMWYGNAREREIDYGVFCILFRSIFLEGFARPFAGVRPFLRQLIKKYRELGGELKLRSGEATGVKLENGEFIAGKRILSSAGLVETMRLCGDAEQLQAATPGELSFVESTSVIDCQPKSIGLDRTIVFFNDSEKFHWEKPHNALCDIRTGVVCSPNNYQYDAAHGELPDGFIRITALANHEKWKALGEAEYVKEKLRWQDRVVASAARFLPDFRRHVIDSDIFTPQTIRRFTWHDNGAVYGAPDKRLDGATHLRNVLLCGSDQGFVGIIGALFSGVSMANQHCLTAE